MSGDVILELVKLSDLARIPGVKGVRARLYCGEFFKTKTIDSKLPKGQQ